MIGSHNTFSYLEPCKWYMKLLKPWSKCQELTIEEQLTYVDYIDIRIGFKDNETWLVHNKTYYLRVNLPEFIISLNNKYNEYYTSNKKIFYRLSLDIRKEPKNALALKLKFFEIIKNIQYQELNIKNNHFILDEARVFWEDWNNPVIKSRYKIEEIHTSVKSPWYKYILGTKWFAKKNNTETYKKSFGINPNIIYLIDFINISNYEISKN